MGGKSRSFIVSFWARLFEFLGKFSVFFLLRLILKKPVTERFVDGWVIGHLVFSVAALFVAAIYGQSWFCVALAFYGFARTFEIVIYQANVMLFDEYRANRDGQEYFLDGYRRMVVLLIHNYFEIIFWLACSYTVFADQYIKNWEAGEGTVIGGIYSSFITMTTFGEFDLTPISIPGAIILMFHATVGLFMTLLSLARFIALLPTPKAKNRMG